MGNIYNDIFQIFDAKYNPVKGKKVKGKKVIWETENWKTAAERPCRDYQKQRHGCFWRSNGNS